MPTSSCKALALAPALLLSACMGGHSGPPSAEYRPSFAAPAPVLAASAGNGAIFPAARGYSPLTSGSRAAQVGDILTIALVERTQALKSNSAVTDRAGDLGLTPPSVGPLSLFDPQEARFAGDQSFNGKGQAAQENRLTGEISVTVAEVYPNGTMLVRGEKLVTLNRGDEYVQLAGLVRMNDIGPDNRIASTRVADAKITYSGRGEIARASKQGWLQRFFSVVSPF